MPPLSRRPQALLFLFLIGFAAALGTAWLRQAPSGGELFLPLAKAADFAAACRSVHGIAWWTPSTLGGHSLATTASTAVDFILLEAGRLAFAPVAGDVGACKIVGLLAMVAAGWAMFRFAAALTGDAATGAWAGIFYAACPELAIRLARAEHLVTALCFPFLPLVLHRLWRLRHEGPKRRTLNCLAAALLLSAMLLTWSKVGFLSLPLVVFFGVWLARETGERRAFLLDCGKVALLVAALAGLVLLPLLREQAWMNLFAFDPLGDWQRGLALKTALSWADRHGALLAQARPDLATAGDAFYIGGVWGAVLAAALFGVGPWRAWRETAEGRLCRFFCAGALFFAWISYGPRSVWGAHLEFVQGGGVGSGMVLLLWLALLVQLAAAARVAAGMTRRRWPVVAIVLAYLFIPGFRLFELIPIYGELRAPASVWTINGSACLALAAALALGAGLRRMPARWRSAGGAAALLLLLLDFSAYHAEFGQGGASPGTEADFQAAADFLRRDPTEGGLYAVSEGCRYLQLPRLTGRALCTEAATSYFQMRATRRLMEAGRNTQDGVDRFLTAAGVAFLVVDKADPAVSPDFVALLRERYAPAYENAHFAVLRLPHPIGPALASGRVRRLGADAPPGLMLAAIARDVWSVVPVAGQAAAPDVPSRGDLPSRSVPLLQPRQADYQTIRVAPLPPGQPWVIVPESYHPDWTAEADGRPIPVFRAAGCYLAAQTPREGAAITFHFRPPAWYRLAWLGGALAWIGIAGWALAETRRLSLRRRAGG